MWKHLAVAALVCLAPLTAKAQAPASLVGRYQLDTAGGDVLELRADGSAIMAGDSTRWSVRGSQLIVGPDVMNFVLQPDRLLLNVGGTLLVWKKLGATAPPAPSGGGDPRDEQARQLLLGSAWCSFTYNKVSGTSTTQRVVFRPDGQMFVNAGAETYNSGSNGSYAGLSSNSGAMRWRLENLRLLVDAGDGSGWQDVNVDASRNSSGAVILRSQGREFAMCR